MNNLIYTVGHSNHSMEYFMGLLNPQAINCLIDVRTYPVSKLNPHYNKFLLSKYLESKKIKYLHLGDELGARQSDPEFLDDDGKVDFEKVRRSLKFNNAVERLRQGLQKGFNIVLMCSEAQKLFVKNILRSKYSC